MDSIRRVNFVYTLRNRNISQDCIDPVSDAFDPIKAAILLHRNGEVEEAFWLVFLATFCGKNLKNGWLMLKQFYSMLNTGHTLTWEYISNNVAQFNVWYNNNYTDITRAFGNHRKFETLKATSQKGPKSVFESYVNWVGPNLSHQRMISDRINKIGGHNPKILFDDLYNSMNTVVRFGRTSRFDYLTMLGKVGLVNIEPPETYLDSSTGPIKGARLMFGHHKADVYKTKLKLLENGLSLGPMAMQVLEDALCNWQKSPSSYKLFMG